MSKKTEILIKLQADSMVMFTKLHNYHWNIKGMQFYGLHQKTEEFYNTFGTMFDDVAERLLQIGSTPLVTLKDILEKATIKEDNKTTFEAHYIVENILADFDYLTKTLKELGANSEGDPTTTAFVDEKVAYLEKEKWMLRAFNG
jgi:starvation-inducible DNA-binding protein